MHCTKCGALMTIKTRIARNGLPYYVYTCMKCGHKETEIEETC